MHPWSCRVSQHCSRFSKSSVRSLHRNKNEWKDGWNFHSCLVGNWAGFLGPSGFSLKRSFKGTPASMNVSKLVLTPGRWRQPMPWNSPALQRLGRWFLWWRWCNRRNVACLTVYGERWRLRSSRDGGMFASKSFGIKKTLKMLIRRR